LVGLFRNFFDPSCYRDDWRSVAFFVKANFKERDGVLLLPPYNRWPFLFYAPELERAIVNQTQPLRFEDILVACGERLAGLRRVWLIERHERLSDPRGLAERFFGRRWGRLVLARNFGGIKVRLFVKRSLSAVPTNTFGAKSFFLWGGVDLSGRLWPFRGHKLLLFRGLGLRGPNQVSGASAALLTGSRSFRRISSGR